MFAIVANLYTNCLLSDAKCTTYFGQKLIKIFLFEFFYRIFLNLECYLKQFNCI